MTRFAAALFLAATIATAHAQPPRWTPAPTPRVGAGEAVTPSLRAGNPVATQRDAPFSGVPNGAVIAGGATSSNTTGAVQTPDPSIK